MKINLLCNRDNDLKPDNINNFNTVVGWSLRKAFRKLGIDCRIIMEKSLKTKQPPKADHVIAISGKALHLVQRDPEYRKRLKTATTGKIAGFLDSDFAGWHEIFDHCFTVVKPKRPQPQYVYAGWGADPDFFYPEQKEKALFLDSLMYNKYQGVYDNIYDTYKELLDIPQQTLSSGDPYTGTALKVGATVHMPLPIYNKRHFPTYWSQMQKIIRRCHYYCCTQLGESGLTRIEAATSGAVLVVPERLYRPRTMGSLECRVWGTRQELIDALLTDVDIEANRKKALEHSWDKVVKRMLKAFES